VKDVGSQRFQFETPAEIKEQLGGAELYPRNNNLLTCFNCPIEERNFSFSIPSAVAQLRIPYHPCVLTISQVVNT
jgi:hypothetical protein